MLRAKKVSSSKKSKVIPVKNSLVLPGIADINQPPTDFLEYTTVIYGTKGIGKTSLVASLSPRTMVFMFEPKRLNLPIRMVQLRLASVLELEGGMDDPWKQFKTYIEMAEEDPSIDSIGTDSIDVAYDCCLNSICAEEGVLHPGGLNDYGATWNRVKSEFTSTFNSIKFDTNLGLFITSHCKEKDIELNTGNVERTFGPSCTGAAEDYVKKAADFAFFFGRHGNARAIHVRWNQTIWTACGVADRFLTSPGGSEVAILGVPTDPKESGKSLVDAFNNKPYKVLQEYTEEVDDSLSSPETEEVEKPKKRSIKRFTK